jgi:hypothetical protein
MFENAEVIHRYTRAQALADGVLVDVSAVAREAGIKYPTALTRAVFDRYVTVPPKVECQDEAGRLWDVVYMLSLACRRVDGPILLYTVYVRNDNRRPRPVRLKAVCGPDDDGSPCLTVMLPDED